MHQLHLISTAHLEILSFTEDSCVVEGLGSVGVEEGGSARPGCQHFDFERVKELKLNEYQTHVSDEK